MLYFYRIPQALQGVPDPNSPLPLIFGGLLGTTDLVVVCTNLEPEGGGKVMALEATLKGLAVVATGVAWVLS
jgi:hypothetical protein